MKKLFVLLRQGNLDEVKRILAEKPELINCVSGPTPKKDHGQSLLQVALKSGNFDIADFLIDAGIDVDFMEVEDDDPGVRAPVLFDAITATIDSLYANSSASEEQLRDKFGKSDRALLLARRIVAGGADVNKRTSHGMSALNWTMHHAGQIMKNAELYPFSQEKVREQYEAILDLLIDNGADLETWFMEGSYPEPNPGPSVKSVYFDPEDPTTGLNYGAVKAMRAFLQGYFKKEIN